LGLVHVVQEMEEPAIDTVPVTEGEREVRLPVAAAGPVDEDGFLGRIQVVDQSIHRTPRVITPCRRESRRRTGDPPITAGAAPCRCADPRTRPTARRRTPPLPGRPG